jgi:hypothetical protein
MSSFLKYLASPDPGDNACTVCGQNRYFCDCDVTPEVDIEPIVTMFHTVSKKKMVVERNSLKYRLMLKQSWVELTK